MVWCLKFTALALVSLLFGISPFVQAKTTTQTYEDRSFELFVPDGVGVKPRPTVFVLHGGGGTGKKLNKQFSFDSWAAKDGAVLIYPDGIDGHWNDGREAKRKRHGSRPDDVTFLTGLAEQLISDGISLKEKIYVIGVSNGGMMTQRLLCDASGQFQAGASIIAGLPVPLKGCVPETPRALLMINGDNDPLMPWNGGGVGFRGKRGDVISGPASFDHWQIVNQCAGMPQVSVLPNTNKRDKTKAQTSVASKCASGNAVEMIRIKEGGHNIPGPPNMRINSRRYKRRAKMLGRYNHDFDARDKIWDFLTRAGL